MLQQLCARRSLRSWLTFQNNSGDRVHSRKKSSIWLMFHSSSIGFHLLHFVYHDSFPPNLATPWFRQMVGTVVVLVRINIGNTYDMNQDNQDPAVVKERVKWIKDKGPNQTATATVFSSGGFPWGKGGSNTVRNCQKRQKMCSFVFRTIFFQNLWKGFLGCSTNGKWGKMIVNDVSLKKGKL